MEVRLINAGGTADIRLSVPEYRKLCSGTFLCLLTHEKVSGRTSRKGDQKHGIFNRCSTERDIGIITAFN